GGRRHLVDVVAAVTRSNRIDPVRAMLGKIASSEQAAELLRTAHDSFGDLPFVKTVRAFGRNPFKRYRHARISKNLAGPRRAPGDEIVERRALVAFQPRLGLLPLLRGQFGDRKPFLRVAN